MGSLRGSLLRKRSRSSVVQRPQAAVSGARAAGEGGDRLVDLGERLRVGLDHVGRQAGLIDPVVEHQLLLERLVALDQMLAQIGEEDRRGHRLEAVALEPALEPRVEALAADGGFDRAQEGRAFFIGDVGQAVVGIAALEVDVQAGVGAVGPPASAISLFSESTPSAICCAATLGP